MSEPDSPSRENSPGSAQVARLQRQLASVRQDLARSQGLKRGKTDPLSTASRGFSRLVCLFTDIHALQSEADYIDALEDGVPDGRDLSLADRRTCDRMYKSYCILLELVPQVGKALMDTSEILTELLTYLTINQIQLKGNTARAEDFLKIRSLLAPIFNGEPYNCLPCLSHADRSHRGLSSDVLGKLICPIEFDWDDMTVRANMRDGEPGFEVATSYYYRCFYRNHKGNPEDVVDGFLRGPLLVQMYQAVFTAPTSMETEAPEDEGTSEEPPAKRPYQDRGESKKPTRTNVATLLNMNGKVTPRSIAYIAVLLHLNLTDAAAWVPKYNGVSYAGLYNFIVDFFEDHNMRTASGRLGKQLADDCLKWWNKKIFPNAVEQPSDVTSRDKLAAQLAAKVAAMAQQQ
ncbi:hypothetical protein HDZ31DRAFT_76928 [Schizophyllum fasciatum]